MTDLPGSTPNLGARVTELTAQSERLTAAVSTLTGRLERTERVTFRTSVAAVVLLLLVVLLGWVAAEQHATADRLDGLIQQSTCPFYGLIVGSYDPNSRPPGSARDKYNQAFVVMRTAYDQLHCTNEIVPPRTSS